MDKYINLYKEAYKRGIIISKDYIKVNNGVICDDDGVELEYVEVFHDEDYNRSVGYYILDGYKSVRVHFNDNMGINSLLKYINKIHFDLGFLNKDKDFNDILEFSYLVSSSMLSHYKVDIRRDFISNVLTMGYETTEDEYSFVNNYRKFYFTDKNLTGEERKRIALINTNKNRRKTTRAKIEEAIEYFIQGDSYITQKNIAEFIGVSIRSLSRNITISDRERIRQRNTELTGYPTNNEYVKNKNIDNVLDSYFYLESKGLKTTSVNISKDIKERLSEKLNRITVSKILKTQELKDIINGEYPSIKKNVNPMESQNYY